MRQILIFLLSQIKSESTNICHFKQHNGHVLQSLVTNNNPVETKYEINGIDERFEIVLICNKNKEPGFHFQATDIMFMIEGNKGAQVHLYTVKFTVRVTQTRFSRYLN